MEENFEFDDIIDQIKKEFIDLYPKNYMGGLELDGKSCEFSLNKVLEILDKYKKEKIHEEVDKVESDVILSNLYCSMEYVLEEDHRSFSNRETENGWLFDHIIEWRKMIRPYIKD